MKKFFVILLLSLLWCEVSFSLTQQSAISQYLSDRKLETIEGIWIADAGRVSVIYKRGNNYYCKVIHSSVLMPGVEYCKLTRGSNLVYYGEIYENNSRGKLNARVYKNSVTFNWTLQTESGSYVNTRIWPDDIESHNANIENKNEYITVSKWHKVAKSNDKELTSYVDKKSIKKKGYKVFYTKLDSLEKPFKVKEGVKAYSIIDELEGNCSNKTMRFMKSIYYQGKMGKGKIIYTDNKISDWEKYTPGTVFGLVLDYVCKRTISTEDNIEEGQDTSNEESEDDWF